MRGRLITLEGGEGAGKSTLLRGLEAHLRAQGVDLVVTREPGGTDVGEAVRAVVLDATNNELCAEAELLLMFASRAQLVRQVIEPALAAGRWVLCDRFTDASFAYQGGGRGQPVERIEALEAWAALGLKPDITLLLDLPVSTGRARAAGRGEADRIEVLTAEGPRHAFVLATNVYHRTPLGWRMVAHHASPGSSHEPGDTGEVPQVLH